MSARAVAHALDNSGLVGWTFACTHLRALVIDRTARHRAETVAWLRGAIAHHAERWRAPSRSA